MQQLYFYKDYTFCGFPPCLDPFLECQRFMNLAVHFRARSSLSRAVPPIVPFLYITLFVWSGGRKEENCGWGWGEEVGEISQS